MPPRLPPGARLLSNVRGGVAWTLWRCRPALGGDAHGHWRPTPCAGRLRRCSRVPTATRARRGSLSPLGDVPSGETDASGVRRPRCAAHSRLTQPALLGGVGGTGRATGGGAHADALSYAVAKAAAVAAAAAAGTPTLIPCCPLLYSFLSEAVRRAYGEALLSTAKDRYALAVLHVALSAGGTTRCVTRVAAIAEVAAARCDARRTATIRLPAAAVYGGSA